MEAFIIAFIVSFAAFRIWRHSREKRRNGGKGER